ncbi:MAG: hypothetical protein RBR68_13120 [Tenuifilaceae bacterium]|nr:hypothetical protein [Tenuifilaceae bacterium]
MSKNIPYEEESSGFSTAVGLTMLAGAGYGIHQGITNEDFRSSLKSKWGKMFKETTGPLSHSGKVAEDIYSKVSSSEKHAATRRAALKKDRALQVANDASDASFVEPVKFTGGKVTPVKALGLQGQDITKDIEEALEHKMGSRILKDKTTWSGSTAKYTFSNGQTLDIPYAVKHHQTGSWVTNKAGTTFVNTMPFDVNISEEGVKRIITSPNERLLSILKESDNAALDILVTESGLGYSGARDIFTKNDTNAIKRILENTTKNIELQNMPMAEKLRKGINQLVATSTQHTASIDLENIDLRGRQHRPTVESIILAEKEYPGAYARQMSIIPGLAQGSNIELTYEEGKTYQKTYNPQSKKFHTKEKKIKLNVALSQGQTAEGVLTSAPILADVEMNDALKSAKGLRFSDNVIEPIYFEKGGSVKPINPANLRKTPVAWREGIEKSSQAFSSMKNEGTINALMLLSPFHTQETVAVTKRIYKHMDVLTPKEIKLKSLANGSESMISVLGKDGQMVSLEFGSVMTNEAILRSAKQIEIRKGTLLGNLLPGEFIHNTTDFELHEVGGVRNVRAKGNLLLEERAIADILGSNNGSLNYFKLSAYMKEKTIKVGSPHGQQRSSISIVNPNSDKGWNLLERFSMNAGGRIAPEGFVSFDTYEKAILSKGSQGVIAGKSAAEYLSFLRESIAGGVAFSNEDMLISGEVGELFQKYMINTPNRSSPSGKINLTKTLNEGKFTFRIGGNTPISQQVLDYERMLASVIHSYSGETHLSTPEGISIGKTARLENGRFVYEDITQAKASEILSKNYSRMQKLSEGGLKSFVENIQRQGYKSIDDFLRSGAKLTEGSIYDYLWPMLKTMAPHETISTAIGLGDSMMRIGAFELPVATNMSSVLEEMAHFNMVNTTKAYTQYALQMKSFAGELTKETLDKVIEGVGTDIPMLDKEGINKMVSGLGGSNRIAKAIENPELFAGTLFNPENNPYGFMINVADKEGGIMQKYIPGGDYYSGAYLIEGEESVERLALLREQKAAVTALNEAYKNEGIMPYDAYKKFQSIALEENINSKTGLLRRAAMQVEGIEYLSNISDSFLMDSYEVKMLNAEAQELLGNATLMSRQDYAKNVYRRLRDANIVAKSKDMDTVKYLREIEGSEDLAQLIENSEDLYNRRAKRAAARGQEYSLDKHYKSISRREAASAAYDWDIIKADIDNYVNKGEGSIDDIINQINSLSKKGVIGRHPFIYDQSLAGTLTFIERGLQKGQISGGKIIRALMNLDNDGDKVQYFMNWAKEAKNQVRELITTDNRMSLDVIQNIKNNNLLKAMFKSETEFIPVGEEFAKSYENFLGALKKETGLAAFITKTTTGSATAKTQSIKAYFEQAINSAEDISDELAREARAIGYNLPAYLTSQNIISSKQFQGVLTKEAEEELSRVAAMMGSIGDVSEKTLEKTISAMGEIHPVVQFGLIDAMKSENIGNYSPEFIADTKSFFDYQSNWRELELEEQGRIYNRFLKERKEFSSLDEFMAAYKAKAENTKFFSQYESMKATGLAAETHLIDIYNKALVNTPNSENAEKLMQLALKSSKENNADFLDEVARTMESVAPHRTRAVAAYMHEAIREASLIPKAVSRFIPLEKMGELASHIKLQHVGIAAGAITVAAAAINLLSGDDGTPRAMSDLPRHDYPGFGDSSSYGGGERRSFSYQPNHNSSINLLTDSGMDHTSLMATINQSVGLNGYNTATSIHDNSNPYSREMSRYN